MSTSDDSGVLLRVEARSPLTEIRISDARFRDVRLPANTGLVETLLPRGVYQVSFREGKALQTQIVLLTAGSVGPVIVKQPARAARSNASQWDEDWDSEFDPFKKVKFTAMPAAASMPSPAPMPAPAAEVSPSARNSLVTIRSCRARTADAKGPLPVLPQLTLVSVNGRRRIAAREADAADPYRRRFEVPPGNWRVSFDRTAVVNLIYAPLTVCPNWHTVLDVSLEAVGPARKASWRTADSEVRLCRGVSTDADPAWGAYARAALSSLTERRCMHGPAFESLLRAVVEEKISDPMLGIYVAHMLPLKTDEERALAGEVVEKLTKLVRGPEATNRPADFVHPDVEALRLRLLLAQGRPLDSIAPFYFLPMLAASWRVLLDAATQTPRLIPKGSFTSRISASLITTGPWLAWARVRRRRAVVKVESEDFDTNVRLIRAALVHSSLRKWYRAGLAGTRPANHPGIGSRERMLSACIRPIAQDEERQHIFDAAFIRTARAGAERVWADQVAKNTGLPPAAVMEAAEMLAAKFLQRARTENIDLIARSAMGVPELISPYDPAFLGDRCVVPLPALSPALRAQAYADAAIIDYTHYSLVMHSSRKVAIFAASNIDAAHKVRVSGKLSWRMDERVGDCQLGPQMHASHQLNCGRLVSGDDVAWGLLPEARHANKSTFFYSNAVPQHQRFEHDEWLTLEDWALDRATHHSCRLCVFTGPVLRDNDPTVEDLPPYHRAAFSWQGAVRIPAAFWKVIVLREGSATAADLAVMAFAMRQSDIWNDTEGHQLQTLKVHQVTLRAIERWTGLDFGDLKRSDELEWLNDRTEWPQIRSGADIVFSGPARTQEA